MCFTIEIDILTKKTKFTRLLYSRMMNKRHWKLYDSKSSKINIVQKSNVPPWLHVPFINSGYVVPGISCDECWTLLFHKTNQTVNAATMLCGALISTILWLWVVFCYKQKIAVFTIFYISCIVHTPFALGNHLLRHQNKNEYRRWKNLDICFIFISSIFLTLALSWYVFGPMISLFLTFSSATLFLHNIVGVKHCGLGHDVNKRKHVTNLVGVVLIYLAPVVWGSITHTGAVRHLGIGIVSCLLVSMLIYLSSFPEKYYPNTFDIYGASHQLLHIGVITAHVLEFFFILFL